MSAQPVDVLAVMGDVERGIPTPNVPAAIEAVRALIQADKAMHHAVRAFLLFDGPNGNPSRESVVALRDAHLKQGAALARVQGGAA